MNKIAKASAVESYAKLIKNIENPRFMDGIFSNNKTRWDISYHKPDVDGFVTKSGEIKRNGIKFSINDKGKLKCSSLKALLSGKKGLKMVESMLNDIAEAIVSPEKINKNTKIQYNLEKSWRFYA